MLFLGILLVVLSGAAASLLVINNLDLSAGSDVTLDVVGVGTVSFSPVELLALGAILALAFCLGVWMMGASVRRRARMMDRIHSAEEEANAAAAERDRLASELRRERGIRQSGFPEHSPAESPSAGTFGGGGSPRSAPSGYFS